MNYQLLMTMPFREAMTLIAKGAVDDYLNRSGLLTAIAEMVKREQQSEPRSLYSKGALAFLNTNGYPMKKEKAIKATKATEVTQMAEVTDANKVTMSGKKMGMFILNKSIDTVMELEKNAPTLQSADEPSLKDNHQRANKFPIDALYSRLQGILNDAESTLGFPTDYLAGAMLTAIASAIGNTCMVEHIIHTFYGNYSKL